MPGVCRLGDVCTGHGPYPPRPNIQASTNVFANGRGVHRLGDAWAIHCYKKCHDGKLTSGSSNTIINNLGAGRCGDSVNCGSSVATCSSNVIIN